MGLELGMAFKKRKKSTSVWVFPDCVLPTLQADLASASRVLGLAIQAWGMRGPGSTDGQGDWEERLEEEESKFQKGEEKRERESSLRWRWGHCFM